MIHPRFSRWSRTWKFEKIFNELASDANNEYAVIDSTIVRAPQLFLRKSKELRGKEMRDDMHGEMSNGNG